MTQKKDNTEKDLKKIWQAYGFEEWMRYMRSPWRIMWTNFLAGLFRWLGAVVGMAVLFSVVIWILTQLVDFPLLGEQFREMKELLENFSKFTQP